MLAEKDLGSPRKTWKTLAARRWLLPRDAAAAEGQLIV